jgi:hypothetical protein
MNRLQRREFITLLGGAAAAWPLAARAQQGERMRRVSVLIANPGDLGKARDWTFRQGPFARTYGRIVFVSCPKARGAEILRERWALSVPSAGFCPLENRYLFLPLPFTLDAPQHTALDAACHQP